MAVLEPGRPLTADPDIGAEGEATIFSSGFEERLDTRLHRTEPVHGAITL